MGALITTSLFFLTCRVVGLLTNGLTRQACVFHNGTLTQKANASFKNIIPKCKLNFTKFHLNSMLHILFLLGELFHKYQMKQNGNKSEWNENSTRVWQQTQNAFSQSVLYGTLYEYHMRKPPIFTFKKSARNQSPHVRCGLP